MTMAETSSPAIANRRGRTDIPLAVRTQPTNVRCRPSADMAAGATDRS